ncbi:TOR1 phosphatidylinositol 3-kinase, partial [Aureobasidium melanogenum]
LKGCQKNVEVWQRMLKVRALVISPPENAEMYIKFASICRKAQRNGLAEKSLNSLLGWQGSLMTPEGQERTLHAPYPVQYAVYKYMWSNGYSSGALTGLRDFTERLRMDYEQRSLAVTNPGTNGMNGMNGTNGVNGTQFPAAGVSPQISEKDVAQLADWQKLLARCYLKQGDWLSLQMRGEWDAHRVHEIRSSYKAATHYNQDWYKAWHAWALANFEVVTALTANKDRGEADGMQRRYIHDYVVPAIQGFFKSIALSSSSSLQDTLRLLTLWFNHGEHQEVTSAVTQGVTTVSIDTWLEVIPQLIARINQPNRLVKESIHHLLCEVGRAHPQALVYPLTVSIKSED